MGGADLSVPLKVRASAEPAGKVLLDAIYMGTLWLRQRRAAAFLEENNFVSYVGKPPTPSNMCTGSVAAHALRTTLMLWHHSTCGAWPWNSLEQSDPEKHIDIGFVGQ